MSRSELDTHAIKQYIAECRYAGVKEKLGQVYASEAAAVDPAVLNAQAIAIPMGEW